MLKRLYDWTLDRAASPHAERFLGFVSFADSSFFPVPPDIMLIPMALAEPKKALRYAAIATVTSVLGAILGYAIGALLFDAVAKPLLSFYGYLPVFENFQARFNAHGWLIMFLFAFTPLPYKVATIAAGATGLSLPAVVLMSILGRGGRFFLVALLMRRFGAQAAAIIDRHFHKLALTFVALLLGSFLVLHYAA
ncbi:YqaA family protein [Sandaracinobacteroides saxicola]|uniref:DedA family protein n=1 Tax=Sandaracinobacteroides saxicola TaxID=2759707 RepID=A0A7G5IHV2_9SPHN|nr:YqaA family protein [Sandaracinobacteroides saxicola]QMW22944.1 DedA family protein [Sandaracinobacteroides saxicola]